MSRKDTATKRRPAISARIFVGNLNFRTTEEDLTEYMSRAGQVVNVHIPTDRVTGRPRGFAFVEFQTDEEAAEAIKQFDGQELDGRSLRVNEAQERPPRGRPRHDRGPGSGHGYDRDRGGRRPPKSKGSRRGLRRRKRSL